MPRNVAISSSTRPRMGPSAVWTISVGTASDLVLFMARLLSGKGSVLGGAAACEIARPRRSPPRHRHESHGALADVSLAFRQERRETTGDLLCSWSPHQLTWAHLHAWRRSSPRVSC